jgi:hypothetical protein
MTQAARSRPSLLLLITLVLPACGDGTPTGSAPDDAPPAGDPLAGMVAFELECASCHASGDGVDLAFFAFPDTTIVRRAVAHVDTSTALDIVAHVATLGVEGEDRGVRLFQPGGEILPSDVRFAEELFGMDGWPADLGSDGLRAIDPLQVRAAVPLPLWSVEEGNTDWMPDLPLPDAILDANGSLPRALVAGYRAAPTENNLVLTTQLLRGASVQRDNPLAPCITNEPERADYARCFEIQRWIATLSAQHMIRFGLSDPIHPAVHDNWWDVGMTVRRAIVRAGIDFESGFENWASWMYLGWIFEPSRHASTYTARGLSNVGLDRHATFVALRSQVARPPRSFAVYADLTTAARHVPPHWVGDAMTFAYRHVLERLAAGDSPREGDRTEARERIVASFAIAARKANEPERAALRVIVAEVLAAFDGSSG